MTTAFERLNKKPKLELVDKEPPTNLPAVLPSDAPTVLPTSTRTHPISPEKDFSKVPNSIKRFVEAGKFPNSSFQIYMFLYSLTRGAIQPKRSVRVNKAKLLNGSDLRSEKALLKNLGYLKMVNLLKITIFNGDHAGNEYEVFIPEEITGDAPTYLPTKQPTYLHAKDTLLPTVQTSVGRTVQNEENKEDADALRHSLNTLSFKIDDEKGILESFEKLNAAAKSKTGKNLTAKDWGSLSDIFGLLIAETEIAASHTKSVSVYLPFMAENLRRRLKTKSHIQKSGAIKDTVGKNSASKPESLDEESKEILLKSYKDILEEYGWETINAYELHFTKEDWMWLKENIIKP
jgi:hypothetical protein